MSEETARVIADEVAPTFQTRERAQTTICRLSPPQDFTAVLMRDVKVGLSHQPCWLPPKYRYDAEGSRICEQMAEAPEYYVNRAETEILMERSKEIMQFVDPDELVELGSGSSITTRCLIEAMPSTGCHRYAPLDISETALHQAADALTADYDWLEINGYLGDFDTDLPKLKRNGRRLVAIFGNSIGNYNLISKTERAEFLAKLGGTLEKGDALLLGVDLVKATPLLLSAYSDSMGLNKQFNLRTLDVVNRELDANFPLEHFQYVCRWDAEKVAILSLLQAQREMKISIRAIPLEMNFVKGDEILVGISCKFTREHISQELAAVGLKVTAWYTDSAEQYGLLIACPR